MSNPYSQNLIKRLLTLSLFLGCCFALCLPLHVKAVAGANSLSVAEKLDEPGESRESEFIVAPAGPWQQADLTDITRAPSASAVYNGYSWETGKSKQVVFSTADGHIHELYVRAGAGWNHADLTAVTRAPSASSVINGYSWESGRSKQVVFKTADGHIHELYVREGEPWNHADLTAVTHAPTASSVINGYSWESGRTKQVVFTTADGHIHELYVRAGGAWSHADLTSVAGAPSASSVYDGYSWDSGRSKQVVFSTADGHIHELFVREGEPWKHADLTQMTGAPSASTVYNGYGWESGSSKQVVFSTADGHIHELYVRAGAAWNHADLTEATGAPSASSVYNGYAWEAGKSKQVVFSTADGHIHELYVRAGEGWKHADLTQVTNAPSASAVIDGYGWEYGRSKQVVFTTADGHIHELYVTL